MNLQPKIIELLKKRGISTEDDITEFLSEKPRKTYDPFLLRNMDAGVDLILSAIDRGKKICIYGDYDADGITSTTLMLEVLSNLTKNLTYYIPSRFDEGYGLNCGALKKIKENGADLVVTVDCGSVSCEEAEYAKSIGLKLLVTDHHTVGERIAGCPVINPIQPGCPYPFKYLAGVGVAFKVAQAIAAETGLPKSVVTRTLDLVGIGTIGDIVPLVDENRTLAKYGLRALNVSKRKGLVRLLEGVGLKQGHIASEDVSFIIVPHLNASGRIADAKTAVRLMTEKNEERIQFDVDELIRCNGLRKKLQEDTFERCREIVEEKYMDDLFYVIDLEDAHEGITGIVAGKVKDAYNRPAVIVTPTGDNCLKGTGRSIEGVNLYQLLKGSEELFERFGGHAAACGFTIKRNLLPVLRQRLNEAMRILFEGNPELFNKKMEADLKVSASEVSVKLVEEMQLLEPFGCRNPRPLVQLAAKPASLQRMGIRGQYTRFTGILDNGKELPCVIFKDASEYDEILQSGKKISIIGTLGIQTWNEKRYLQLQVSGAEE